MSTLCPLEAAMSVPKKRKNMKEFNKKEAIGDLLDAFTEVSISPDENKIGMNTWSWCLSPQFQLYHYFNYRLL